MVIHKTTGAPYRLVPGPAGIPVQGPWNPPGSVVVSGVTVVPGNYRLIVKLLSH